ncbi:MAG: DNA repair protein RecN [Nonlabens sp.]
MLQNISIKNYALIEELQLELVDGLTIITGETGAGKSIILGALGLVLGKRADLTSIRDSSRKCIVEAEFVISELNLEEWFDSHDLDYDKIAILRREISPSGKSRAFINDTPVKLSVVSDLGTSLIDIHSQHQTLQLATYDFQAGVLNSFVDDQSRKLTRNGALVSSEYAARYNDFNEAVKELKRVQELKSVLDKELDYNTFLLEELEQAQLDAVNESQLEEENEKLSNVEGITSALSHINSLIEEEDLGILERLRHASQLLREISPLSSTYEALHQRLSSVTLELEDLQDELSNEMERVVADPERLTQINETLSLLNNLYKKHQVSEVDELLSIRDELASKVLDTQGADRKIKQTMHRVALLREEVTQLALEKRGLHEAYIPQLELLVLKYVHQLGMPDAQFHVQLIPLDEFDGQGLDKIVFVFTANKGSQLLELDKAASGGELSRLMLSIKAILSGTQKLPTLVFDEIDTGVSGAIAQKMAGIMKDMSKGMQIMTITHLPQIAAAGKDHLLVRKSNDSERTTSQIVRLDHAGRVEEVAQMLSGGTISSAARENARILLNQS